MQKCNAREVKELVDVQSTWTEKERAERRLLAQRKQKWLGKILGIEAQFREIEKSTLALAQAG